ncbi:hypothetical protein CRYUN_Cryun11dG0081300 [Craigia yunnanensis]
MVNIFSRRKAESGLHYLKKAVEKGHVEAIYTYGIILICLGGDLRKQGFQVVSSLNLTSTSKKSFNIYSCRSKTEKLLSSMWVYVCLASPKEYSVNIRKLVGCNCDNDMTLRPKCLSSKGQTWEASNNQVDNLSCDYCFWHCEATLFCSMVRKNLVNLVFQITKKQQL